MERGSLAEIPAVLALAVGSIGAVSVREIARVDVAETQIVSLPPAYLREEEPLPDTNGQPLGNPGRPLNRAESRAQKYGHVSRAHSSHVATRAPHRIDTDATKPYTYGHVRVK